MPRQRAFRSKVITINEDKPTYIEHNKKLFEQEIQSDLENQEKVSSPQEQSQSRVQIVKIAHTDTKKSLADYLANEAQYRKVSKETLSMKPMEAVETFKAKAAAIIEKIEAIKKKAKTSCKLSDMLMYSERVKNVQETRDLPGARQDLKNNCQFSQIHNLIGESFGSDKKVTLELYPYKRPDEDLDKEKRETDKLEIVLAQVEEARPLDQYSFFAEGVTVPEALAFVKRVLAGLENSGYLKEVLGKVDKNVELIESLKYALSGDDKFSEEEKETFTKISNAWKLFQFLIENQKTIGNSMIFYSVFSSVQKQLQSFGDDINKFDTNAKSLLESSNQIVKKITESKEKMSASFVEDIQKELDSIEKQVRSTQSN